MLIVSMLKDLSAFPYWSGAIKVADKLTETHRWNEVEALLEGIEYMTDEALNQFVWFEVPDKLHMRLDNDRQEM